MTTATRTLNPLHFEDLEPKRFEDLVRQLAHDFKPWRKLEATGRAGSDDGFDARGYEMVGPDGASEEEEDVDDSPEPAEVDRLWLIQCKREQKIGPAKLASYLDQFRLRDGERLYGLVFVAACTFSKEARDAFDRKCEALGLREWHLWGKGELEDKLLRSENDHLLFAYFNISLVIRRRSQRARIRTRLTIKRKVLRVLGLKRSGFVLLRSPDAIEYPKAPDEVPDFDARRPWIVRKYLGTQHDGLKVLLRQHFAYLADDGLKWDAAVAHDNSIASDTEDWWNGVVPFADERRSRLHRLWLDLPERNRAWLDIVGVIPYENILDIDEAGDEYACMPHVYATFEGKNGPCTDVWGSLRNLDHADPREFDPLGYDGPDRVTFFEEALRRAAPETASD